MFENIENLNKTASMAVSAFGVDGNAIFVQISENATYFICKNNKPKYTLRICRPNYHTFEELESEIQWLLNIDNVNICKPILKNGEYVKKINGCYCTMYKYIEGMADIEIEGNENLYIEIGRIAGLLHKNTIEKPFKAVRPKWSMENLIGKKGLWGDWRKTAFLNSQQKDIIEKACNKIYEKVANYKTDKYGLIHIDLRLTNIIVGKTTGVIDFDDCGYGYFMQDLASSVSFLENSPQLSTLIENWYKGYEEVMPLDSKDKEMAKTFILARQIQLLAWVTSHSKSTYVQGIDKDFPLKCFINAEKYLKFGDF